MNGTMPAMVNSNEGSGDTSEVLGTTVWPRFSKCSRNRRRISAVCMRWVSFSSQRVLPGRAAGSEGSAVRGVRAASGGQGGVRAVGQRCVQSGARAQLALARCRCGTHVGAEVTDRFRQVPQAVGEGPGDP